MAPVLDVPDNAPNEPALAIVTALKQLILNACPPRLAIGIFGGYGSGKSTILDALEREIAGTESPRTIIPVRFNAWTYDSSDSLLPPFLSALRRGLEAKNLWELHATSFVSAAYGFLRSLTLSFEVGPVKVESDTGRALKHEQEFAQDTIDRFLQGFNDLPEEIRKLPRSKTGEIDKLIVVMIDDLDRCLPKRALQLLESLKSLMDTEGFIFLIALDPRAIRQYAQIKFGEDFPVTGEEYLEKLIQVPVELPSPTADIMTESIKKWLSSIEDSEGEASSTERHSMSLALNCVKYLPLNYRQVKRIINTHATVSLAHGVEHERDKLLLFLLLVIRNRWPAAFWALRASGAHARELVQGAANRKDFESRFGYLIESPEGISAIWKQFNDDAFESVARRVFEQVGTTSELFVFFDILGWNQLIGRDLIE